MENVTKMEKKRIVYLDALKGLCMLLVINGHVLKRCGILPYDGPAMMIIYAFPLPVFFFISGFLTYKQSMTAKDFWTKLYQKFIYLVIPAFVFLLVAKLLAHRNPLSIFTQGMLGYWFPVVLFECILIYYLSVLIIKNENWRLVLLLILSVAGFLLTSVCKNFGPAILDLHRLSKLFQFFAVGLLARRYREKYESLMQNEIVKAVSLLTFFIVLFLTTYKMHPSLYQFLRDEVLRYAGSIAVLSFFACNEAFFIQKNKFNTMLNYVGQTSFAIYLLHFFFLPKFTPLPSWLDNLNMTTIFPLSWLYVLVVAGLCVLFIKFLSNSKFIRKYAFGQK